MAFDEGRQEPTLYKHYREKYKCIIYNLINLKNLFWIKF